METAMLRLSKLTDYAVVVLVRLNREEDLLMQDPAYREYAKQVPYRLIPRVY